MQPWVPRKPRFPLQPISQIVSRNLLSFAFYSPALPSPWCYKQDVMWHTLDTVCHGSKRSSSCRHVDVKTEKNVLMNMYRFLGARPAPACKYARVRSRTCVRISHKLQGQRVGSAPAHERVWRVSGPLSLFFISALHFSLLFEVARGYCALISCAGLSLIYVLVDWSEVQLMSCDLKATVHFVLCRTGQNVLNHWCFAPITVGERKNLLLCDFPQDPLPFHSKGPSRGIRRYILLHLS